MRLVFFMRSRIPHDIQDIDASVQINSIYRLIQERDIGKIALRRGV